MSGGDDYSYLIPTSLSYQTLNYSTSKTFFFNSFTTNATQQTTAHITDWYIYICVWHMFHRVLLRCYNNNMASDDVPDVSHLLEVGDFDTQVQQILDNVRLMRFEVDGLRILFDDLEQTLQSYWPGCTVLPFGSIVTGLGIKTSDVDCFIRLPEQYQSPSDKYVMTAKHILQRHSARYKELFAITAAKVPIVKFFHVPTQRHCDVSFKSFAGVRNSRLLAKLFQMDRRALVLAVLVKYWSKVHRLTGTNLVPNYTLTLMVVYYLQHVKILPPVKQLQYCQETIMVDDWDTSFDINYFHQNSNNQCLYDLLGGFFEFYSNYNFKDEIISPFLGNSYSKKLFMKADDVPEEFELYILNVTNNWCRQLKTDTAMCIQDPFEHSRNTAVGVYPRLADSFICHLKYGADRYKDTSKNKLLKALLTVKLEAPPQKQFMNHGRRAVVKRGIKMKRKQKLNRSIHNFYIELNRLKKIERKKNHANKNI